MASSTRVKSTRKRTQFTAKQVAEMLMDSDEESIGNDDYDSSELETEEEDDESHDTQGAFQWASRPPTGDQPVTRSQWNASG